MALQDIIELIEEFEKHVPVDFWVEGDRVVPEIPPDIQQVLRTVYGKYPEDLIPHPYGLRFGYVLGPQNHPPDWIKAHAKTVIAACLRYQTLHGYVWAGELTVGPSGTAELAVRNLLGDSEEPEWVLHGGGRWLRLADCQLERILAQL
jgi:hypothetical protein